MSEEIMNSIVESIKENVLQASRLFTRQVNDAMNKYELDKDDLIRIVETSRAIIRLMTAIWREQNGEDHTEYVNHSVSIPKGQKE